MNIPYLDKYILIGTFYGRVIIHFFTTNIYKIITLYFPFIIALHNLISFENVNP